ncbi:MAG: RNA polymerase sigma factor, partial [Myxococcota bacterium]
MLRPTEGRRRLPGNVAARDEARTRTRRSEPRRSELRVTAHAADLRVVPPADEPCVEQWYRQHHARLRAHCSRLLGDPATAEDIAQEALLRAWSNRDRFEPGADIGPWLFRVARNLCTDVMRTRSRVVIATPPEQADTDADPALPIERAETDALVRRALDGLTPRQRQALMLRDVEGIEYPELASRMGVDENAARAMLFRARRGLRKRFLEVARATAALALWPFLRVRAGRRSMTVEQLSLAAGHAGLSIVAVVALLVAPAQGDVLRAAATEAAARASVASATVEAGVGLVGTGEAAGRPSMRPSTRATILQPSVAVTANRRGEAHVRVTTPNPVTGDEADIFADVWREADGKESTVLNLYDDVNETACAGLSGGCESVDGALNPLE